VVTEPPKPVEVPPVPTKPATDLRDVRDKNNEVAFKAVEDWCKSKGYDYSAYAQRLALALVTESSGGYIYANDGTAYDSTKKTPWNDGLTPAVQERVSFVLRQSLTYPYNRIGSNGRSTGMLQQISLESNQALFGKTKTWGWGSIPETMDPAKSAIMFVEALRITNDPIYKIGEKSYTTPSPVIADVLRVQQPLVSEALGSNYSQKNLDWAKAIAKNPSRYFSDL
jgi:hypothetical protein